MSVRGSNRVRLGRDAAFVAIGVGALILLVSHFGLTDVLTALRGAAPGELAVYGVLVVVAVVGQALRWRFVCRALGIDLGLGRFLKARLAGDAVGWLVPSARMAGDPVRFALVYAHGGRAARTGAGVVIDRILEVTANLICAIVYVALFVAAYSTTRWVPGVGLLAGTAGLLTIGVVVMVMLARRGIRPLGPLYGPRARRKLPRLAGWMNALERTEHYVVRFVRDDLGTFTVGLLGSLAIEGVVILEYRALLSAFGIQLGLPMLLMALLTLGLTRAAPTPGGLGALEAGQVALLELSTGQGEVGFVVGMVMRLHETLWTLVGLGVLGLEGVSLRSAGRLAQSAGEAVR